MAPQSGPPHPRGPDSTYHLDDRDPTSPRPTHARRSHGPPAPTVPNGPGGPEAGGRHQPPQSPHRRPTGMAPPCDPQRSPLRPFSHHGPDHDDQRALDGATGQHSPRTPQPPQGTRRLADAQDQSCMPPSAARRVTFRAGETPGKYHPQPDPSTTEKALNGPHANPHNTPPKRASFCSPRRPHRDCKSYGVRLLHRFLRCEDEHHHNGTTRIIGGPAYSDTDISNVSAPLL